MKAYILLAEGFEEVEALTSADILSRAGVTVALVKIPTSPADANNGFVSGSHKITVKPDIILKESNDCMQIADGDCIILPGGMPGTTHLSESTACRQLLKSYSDNGKLIAAICAAPSILGENGILKGKKATCFPGFESKLIGAEHVDAPAVTDGNIITGKSMGCAVSFALAVAQALVGKKAADKIEASIFRG